MLAPRKECLVALKAPQELTHLIEKWKTECHKACGLYVPAHKIGGYFVVKSAFIPTPNQMDGLSKDMERMGHFAPVTTRTVIDNYSQPHGMLVFTGDKRLRPVHTALRNILALYGIVSGQLDKPMPYLPLVGGLQRDHMRTLKQLLHQLEPLPECRIDQICILQRENGTWNESVSLQLRN